MEQLRDHLDRLAVVMALALRRVWEKVSSLEARVGTLEANPAASAGEVEPIAVERLRREIAADRAVTRRIAEEVFGSNPGEGTGLRTIMKAIVGVQGTLRDRLLTLATKVADLRDEVYGDMPGNGVRCLIAGLLGTQGKHERRLGELEEMVVSTVARADRVSIARVTEDMPRVQALETWKHDIETGDALQTAAANAAADETASIQGQVDALNLKVHGTERTLQRVIAEGSENVERLAKRVSKLRADHEETCDCGEQALTNIEAWQKVFAAELERLAGMIFKGEGRPYAQRIRALEGETYDLRAEVEALRGVVAGYQETFANILPRLADLEKSGNRLLIAEQAIEDLKAGAKSHSEWTGKHSERIGSLERNVGALRAEVFTDRSGSSKIVNLSAQVERLQKELFAIQQAREGGF